VHFWIAVPEAQTSLVQVSEQVGAHLPQSCWQELQVSLPLQEPSPQTGAHLPQSASQLLQFSLLPQEPSPHVAGHDPQSMTQFAQVSLPLHTASPHLAAGATEPPPQSTGQATGPSPTSQTPLPQMDCGVPWSSVWHPRTPSTSNAAEAIQCTPFL
jgi:hypothetical protein